MNNEKDNTKTDCSNEYLVDQIQRGIDVQANYEKLWLQNRPMIARTINQFSGLEDPDDLMQEAFLCMISAASSYDPEAGCKFLTYCIPCIRGGIMRYLEEAGRLNRIPSYMVQLIGKYKRFTRKYVAEHGEKPSAEMVQNALQITPEQLETIKSTIIASSIKSLSEAVSDEENDITLGDTIADPVNDIENKIEAIFEEQRSEAIRSALNDLQQEQKNIIVYHYFQDMTYAECGEVVGASASRVRKMEHDALVRLRYNKKVIGVADDSEYGSYIYKGGLTWWKYSGSSVVEYAVIKKLDEEA